MDPTGEGLSPTKLPRTDTSPSLRLPPRLLAHQLSIGGSHHYVLRFEHLLGQLTGPRKALRLLG